jgi:hypothetical protein
VIVCSWDVQGKRTLGNASAMPYVRSRNSATSFRFLVARGSTCAYAAACHFQAWLQICQDTAQSLTISGTVVPRSKPFPWSWDVALLPPAINWWIAKLRVPHFEIGPRILCRARQAFKVLAASFSIGLCEVLFR